MTTIKEDKRQDDLNLAFHNWKNDPITQMFFRMLDNEKTDFLSRLSGLYISSLTSEQILMQLGGTGAIIRFIDEIKNSDLERLQAWGK